MTSLTALSDTTWCTNTTPAIRCFTHSLTPFNNQSKGPMSNVTWDFILSAVVTVRITNTREVTPCILVDIYRRFRRKCGLYCQYAVYKIGVQKQFGITLEVADNFTDSDIATCVMSTISQWPNQGLWNSVSHEARISLIIFLAYTLTNAISEPIPYDADFCVETVRTVSSQAHEWHRI